jgi:hypothetical protein
MGAPVTDLAAPADAMTEYGTFTVCLASFDRRARLHLTTLSSQVVTAIERELALLRVRCAYYPGAEGWEKIVSYISFAMGSSLSSC